MRTLLLALLLAAAFGGASLIPASPRAEYGATEARHLVLADSLVSDGELNVADDYAQERHRAFHPLPLETTGRFLDGRLHEPYAPGYTAGVAPAYLVGGAMGVALTSVLLAVVAFAAAVPLARTLVPEPWATWGVLLVALSPPAVAHAGAVGPGWAAAAALTVAILLAVRVREDARLPPVAGCALALSVLPWLDVATAIAGLPVAAMLLHWTLRRHRRLAAIIAFELLAASLIGLTSLSEILYGGITPLAAAATDQPPLAAGSLEAQVERAPQLVALWLDREVGVLRWAPVLALAFHGAWLLWRSRRDHIARALPGRREGEGAAALSLSVVLTVLAVAAFGADPPSPFPGAWLVPALPPSAVLVAWSLRHAARAGAALGALTLAATAWLVSGPATGGQAGWSSAAASAAPWGPLEAVFPVWGEEGGWSTAVTVAVAMGLGGLIAAQWRGRRRSRVAEAPRRV